MSFGLESPVDRSSISERESYLLDSGLGFFMAR
jgi:hypothetical protein